MRWGRAKNAAPRFKAFRKAVNEAAANFQGRLEKRLYRKASNDPRVMLEILARRDPDHWSPPKDRVEVDANLKHSGGVRVWLPPEDDGGRSSEAG